jgi:hypothetical protein
MWGYSNVMSVAGATNISQLENAQHIFARYTVTKETTIAKGM